MHINGFLTLRENCSSLRPGVYLVFTYDSSRVTSWNEVMFTVYLRVCRPLTLCCGTKGSCQWQDIMPVLQKGTSLLAVTWWYNFNTCAPTAASINAFFSWPYSTSTYLDPDVTPEVTVYIDGGQSLNISGYRVSESSIYVRHHEGRRYKIRMPIYRVAGFHENIIFHVRECSVPHGRPASRHFLKEKNRPLRLC